jgi:hypothetical protein
MVVAAAGAVVAAADVGDRAYEVTTITTLFVPNHTRMT